jgi:hypothetical protein
MNLSTRDDDPDNSPQWDQPEIADLARRLIGCPDLTVVEHRNAPVGTVPCMAVRITADGRTWWCTRVAGHAGEHMAGTGVYIAFAWVGGDTRW